jgi:excisionase family DNA binding protein
VPHTIDFDVIIREDGSIGVDVPEHWIARHWRDIWALIGQEPPSDPLSEVQRLPELSPPQLAILLQIPKKTILQLCAAGKMVGSRKIGRQWRINAESFFRSQNEAKDEDAGSSEGRVEGRALEPREKADNHLPRDRPRSKGVRGPQKARDRKQGHRPSIGEPDLRQLLR